MKQSTGIDSIFRDTHRKVLSVTRKYYLMHVMRAILKLAAYALGLLIIFAIVEMVFDLSTPVRSGFWIGSAGLLIYFLFRSIIPDFRRAFRPGEQEFDKISRQIGKGDPEVQDSLINFLQIYREKGITTHPAFKNLSLKQLYKQFKNIDFSRILSFNIVKDSITRLGWVGLSLVLLFLVFPSSMSQAVLKVIYPGESFEKPLPLILQNVSGEINVLKNEAVSLNGSYDGLAPHKLWLVVESEAANNDSTIIDRIELPATVGKSFSYEIPHVKNSFQYWFEARMDMTEFRNRLAKSEAGKVLVKDRPFIRELQAKLTPPSYTRLPEILLPPNNGEITALNGTTVQFEIQANKSLEKAWCVFADSTTFPLQVVENKASGRFTVSRDNQYQIRILDQEGISNYQPVQYSVFALADEHPYVEIARPGQDLDLGNELQLPMLVNIRDDFGFRKLLLKGQHIRAGGSGDTSTFEIDIPYQKLDQNRGLADFRWDLGDFYMVPEDYLEYYAEIYDNDIISGPKSSRSKTFILRLPSLIEILENSDEQIAEQLDETEDVARETEELREKLEEINREMQREEELTWERKQQIQEQLEKQKSALEKLENVQQELENLIQDMEKQEMLSPETMEKYMELQKMFQELASEELLDAMKKMQESMDQMNMDEVKKAMEQFKLSMEEFEQKIERTFELFKRIELEQKMDQLAQMAEKMTEEQETINEQLENENLSEADQEQLAEQEESLEKNADFFEEKLEEAKQAFQEDMAQTAQELQEIQEMMASQEMQQQMQQMQEQMKSGEMQEAKKQGENLKRDMEMLQAMMQQARENMNQAQKEELMQAMQKVQQDMLRASFKQEQLMERTSKMDVASPQVTDVARQQSQMKENVNNIISQVMDIAKETFFVSSDMNKMLAGLKEEMDASLAGLENRNMRSSARSQNKAMSNLNQAIMSMQNSMNQMSMAGSASGFEEMMQQLSQMAGQQGQLNQEAMGMMPKPGQGRMQLSQDAAGRLAAQQEMIRQSLEKMNQENGGGGQKDVLGRLGELGEEMEKVIQDLQKQRLDRNVIERQQRILSRMLDAQKSVREREYSKKRQAEKDRNFVAKSPPELKQELLEREDQLRQEMLKALKEGYSSEYKEYIKSYYEILSRQGGNASQNNE